MAFEYKNSKGKTYYLHQRGKLFFFSGKSEESIDLPEGYQIVENKVTGLPMVKKS